MPQHMIRIYVKTVNYEFDGETIDDVILWLQKEKVELFETWPEITEIKFSYRQEPYEDYYSLFLEGYRPENEDEMKARIEKEKAEQARRDEYQRRQYEALKAKFE